MNTSKTIGCVELIAFVALVASCSLASAQEPKAASVSSPDGRLTARIWVRETSDNRTEVVYDVDFNGKPVLLPSTLGIELTDGVSLGSHATVEQTESRQINTRFLQFPGKRRVVEDRCTELTVSFVEHDEGSLRWQVVLRAYDDGIALRYRFPAQPGWQELQLARERTEFAFPQTADAVFLPLDGFVSSHEGIYQQRAIVEIPTDQLMDVPALVEVPDVGWIAVGEASLVNYAGLSLSHDSGSRLVSKLSPRVDEPAIAVRAPLPAESPWRVICVAPNALGLIESDLVLKLNAPTALSDTAWIKPGMTTFPWWNGYFEERQSLQPGLNTEFIKHYIDFCAEYGIPFHSLDGLGNTAWYGGPIVPYEGDDPTTAVEGLDLPEVLAYAKRKGVKLRLWMHWQAAQAHMERAFPLYSQWGIEGVMIDFMDRNDQEMVNFQRRLLQLAADNHLTVNFHGAAPPTGLERTFPNLLNSEAVMNLEYDKWDPNGIPPEHDVTVPFTRMLAGPMDYHQGSLRTVPLTDFTPREAAPLVIGTPCRTLASYVVFQNHLPMVADYPSAYRRHPLSKVLTSIPTTWDDTRALAGTVGESVVIARRVGNEWWIGAMTDRRARTVSVPLDFLDAGTYLAEVYEDDASPNRFRRTQSQVSSASALSLALGEAGGALVHLSPAPVDPPGWKLVWSDDFDHLDREKWRVGDAFVAPKADDSDFDPNLVSVANGILQLQANGDGAGFGRLVSKYAQKLGRWEIRAQVPSAVGVKSMLRLLPDAPWPSQGEIDIMTSDGGSPHITSSEFHWGTLDSTLIAPREVEARAVGETSVQVTWQPSQNADDYLVARRRQDTETEFTVIAPNVVSTSYTDTGLAANKLYEYVVIAQRNPSPAPGEDAQTVIDRSNLIGHRLQEPYFHDARSIPQRASEAGQLVSFPDGFHTYTVEWTHDQLRYYVDDLYHTVFYSDEVGDFLPKLVSPMHLAIDMEPSGASASPKIVSGSAPKFLVDWVRVYEPDSTPIPRRFVNGDFEMRGGSLTGWHIFANRMTGEPNISPSWKLSRHGNWSLALSGQSSDGDSYAGVSQGISVSPGQKVRASLFARIGGERSLAATSNRVSMKIEFYNQAGSWFGGPAMLDVQEIIIGDRSTRVDTWRQHTLDQKAPAGAVEARLSLVFAQSGNEPGAIYIDEVEFVAGEE